MKNLRIEILRNHDERMEREEEVKRRRVEAEEEVGETMKMAGTSDGRSISGDGTDIRDGTISEGLAKRLDATNLLEEIGYSEWLRNEEEERRTRLRRLYSQKILVFKYEVDPAYGVPSSLGNLPEHGIILPILEKPATKSRLIGAQ